jgi:hypothetical protein
MAIYTIIFDYRGGTYIRQVTAESEQSAFIAWSNVLKAGVVQGLGPKRLARLVKEVAENFADLNSPVPLTGLTNVWCASLSRSVSGLVHIVKTDVTL